jgi:hypothetical protein
VRWELRLRAAERGVFKAVVMRRLRITQRHTRTNDQLIQTRLPRPRLTK